MLVSVIICAYTYNRLNDIREAIYSILNQTYRNFEYIVTIDEDRNLYKSIKKEFGSISNVKILFNKKRIGLPASRNRGIETAEGEIIAFFDDDAIADKNWLEELVRMYKIKDAIAVGGKILPLWIGKKPKFLPEEFYWLLGVTYRGFVDDLVSIEEVRNTFTSNLSFRSEVLKSLGGFKSELKEKSARALEKVRRGGIKPLRLDGEITVEMRFFDPDLPDILENINGFERLDGTSIQYRAKNIVEAYKMIEIAMIVGIGVNTLIQRL